MCSFAQCYGFAPHTRPYQPGAFPSGGALPATHFKVMETMNDTESLSLVIAAGQTVMRMYHALDRSDYSGASKYFTPDGVWERAGNALHGQQQILASLNQRSATLFTRHYVTNFVVFEHSGPMAKAAFSLSVYRSDKNAPPTLPVGPAIPAMLADAECELVCNDGGDWLINRLAPVITFAA
ncbi:nuclear transport factor 2 family protein [Cupriavidus necator]|nr:nuclear transport factor 2 family protein [Cupriavidus necator]